MGGVKDFSRLQQRFAKLGKLPHRLMGAVQNATMIAGSNAAILGTPVDRAHARVSWKASTDDISTDEVPEKKRTDKKGTEPLYDTNKTVEEATAVFAGAEPFSKLYLTNNSPHAFVLELGAFEPQDPGPSKDRRKGRKDRVLVKGGYSVQAPEGMLRQAVMAMETTLKRFASAAQITDPVTLDPKLPGTDGVTPSEGGAS